MKPMNKPYSSFSMNSNDLTLSDLFKGDLQLSSPPAIYFQLKKVIDDPNKTMADVGNVIDKDPGLTMRLLKLVNSAFFGFASEINSVSRAVNIMGLAQVHDLVLTISAVNTFQGINNELIDMKAFWLHSVYCAAIAKLLARKCHIVDSDRLFVTGILHDVGHLVIYTRLPNHAENLLLTAKTEQIPLSILEKKTFGFDYAEVGGELLKLWKLPACFYQAVYQHTHVTADSEFSLESAIVHVANILALQDSSQKIGFNPPELNSLCLQLIEIEADELQLIKNEAKKSMADILKLLFSR
jgi:HD-like signal output (HDOD) protein